MDPRKIDQRGSTYGVAPSSNDVTTELSEAELSKASGGKAKSLLLSACAKGRHIPQVTIEVW
jgi:hypothetical protein